MVHTTVRPVLTVFRTVRITIAAARASRPLVGSSCVFGNSSQAHSQQQTPQVTMRRSERPVLTVVRTMQITMAAIRASIPLVGSSCKAKTNL